MTQTDLLNGALPIEIQHGTLLHLLANSLILGNTAPYLSCFDLWRDNVTLMPFLGQCCVSLALEVGLESELSECQAHVSYVAVR